MNYIKLFFTMLAAMLAKDLADGVFIAMSISGIVEDMGAALVFFAVFIAFFATVIYNANSLDKKETKQ